MNSTRREFLTIAGSGAAVIAAEAGSAAGNGAKPVGSRPSIGSDYRLPMTSRVRFRSKVNNVLYELYVRVPYSYKSGSGSYPVVWLLDADYSFAIASNHLEHLADRGHIPEQIVVAIAYPEVNGDRDRYRRERTRDYTPIYWPDAGYGPAFQKYSGGGPAFLRMIEAEAMPLIERIFRVDPTRRTFSGHSYGGLFASWVFQTRPELFSRYLIVSPSLWYGDGWLLERERRKDFRPVRSKTAVWTAAGNWEQQASQNRMVTDVVQFTEMLKNRNDAKLTAEHRTFSDETHASIWPAAFSTGIRHLYPTDWLQEADPLFLEPCKPII